MQIQFAGAAGGVTGSKHLLEVNGKRILLDCGLFQGRRKEALKLNREFLFDPESIDCIVLSHAHIDHSGAIPAFVKAGFSGSIYCTHATRDLCSIMLRDSAYIQEKDAEWMRKKSKNPEAEPLYTIADAEKALALFRSVAYEQKTHICHGVYVTFSDAGHILGSAVETWDIFDEETKQDVRLGFTGDLGRHDLPILKNPTQLRDLDVLITESTYGNRFHDEIEGVKDQLARTVNETVERGGKILIPAFAVERTQEILYVLRELILDGKIPKLPTFVDSPLAVAATDIFRLHNECFDSELCEMLKKGRDPFSEEHNVQFVQSVHESKALNDFPGSAIIISASGMCEAGRIQHHLINNITDSANTVLIVGFMAENTLGRRLVEVGRENVGKAEDGCGTVNIFGEPYPLRAEVVIFNAFSAHADQGDLLRFAGGCGRPKAVFCVQGEKSQVEVLQKKISLLPNCEGAGVFGPSLGERFLLGEGGGWSVISNQ